MKANASKPYFKFRQIIFNRKKFYGWDIFVENIYVKDIYVHTIFNLED